MDQEFLLFMAPMAAHMIPDGETLPRLLLAFVAFSLCASAVYVANDLLDLDSDRQHPRSAFARLLQGRYRSRWVSCWYHFYLCVLCCVQYRLAGHLVPGSCFTLP